MVLLEVGEKRIHTTYDQRDDTQESCRAHSEVRRAAGDQYKKESQMGRTCGERRKEP